MKVPGLSRWVWAVALLGGGASLEAFDASHWVWQRNDPLTPVERAEFKAQGIQTLYWQCGVLSETAAHWAWTARFHPPDSDPEMTIVRVVRLETTGREPFADAPTDELRALLAVASDSQGELQIDYDCPDRLLGKYASALGKIRPLARELSITALAGWMRQPGFPALQASVDLLAPMFYDLEQDPVRPGEAQPLPLLDPARLRAQLAEWDRCQTPWRAGLPNFSRVTVYNEGGRSLGHVRSWDWDDLCFNRALAFSRLAAPGVTVFKVMAKGALNQTALAPGQSVAVRWPERSALAEAIAAVRQTSARGVIYFRLPGGGGATGWSLRQAADWRANPKLAVRWLPSLQLELRNAGDGDLAPRLSGLAGGQDRNYALEVDAPGAVFRDAAEGDFWRVAGHVHPEEAPQAAAIPLATRLTFWFSRLAAGQSLRSGAIRLAPETDFRQLRYRVLNGGNPAEWQTLSDN